MTLYPRATAASHGVTEAQLAEVSGLRTATYSGIIYGKSDLYFSTANLASASTWTTLTPNGVPEIGTLAMTPCVAFSSSGTFAATDKMTFRVTGYDANGQVSVETAHFPIGLLAGLSVARFWLTKPITTFLRVEYFGSFVTATTCHVGVYPLWNENAAGGIAYVNLKHQGIGIPMKLNMASRNYPASVQEVLVEMTRFNAGTPITATLRYSGDTTDFGYGGFIVGERRADNVSVIAAGYEGYPNKIRIVQRTSSPTRLITDRSGSTMQLYNQADPGVFPNDNKSYELRTTITVTTQIGTSLGGGPANIYSLRG